MFNGVVIVVKLSRKYHKIEASLRLSSSDRSCGNRILKDRYRSPNFPGVFDIGIPFPRKISTWFVLKIIL